MFESVLAITMLLLGGFIACYGLIIAQAPDIKEKFDAIIPFQGVIGAILIILGILDLFRIGVTINLLENNFIVGLIALLLMISKLVLGFILGYGLITRYLTSSNQVATEKIQKTYQTLVVVQVPFGILAILLALASIVLMIIY